jgi:hypothetical protein
MTMITRSISKNINGNWYQFLTRLKPKPDFAIKWTGSQWIYVPIKKRRPRMKKF